MGLLVHYFKASDPTEQLQIVMELMRVRVVLIPEVVRRASERGDDSQLAALSQRVEQLAVAFEEQNIPAMADLELDCYRLIMEASQSLTYLWVYNSFEKIVRGFIGAQPHMWIAVPGFVDMWRGIAAGLQRRDAETAEAHFRSLAESIEGKMAELSALIQEST